MKLIIHTVIIIICIVALTGCASTVLGMVASAGGSYIATKELDEEKNTAPQTSLQKNYIRHPVNSFEVVTASEPIAKAPEIKKTPQNNDEQVTAIINNRFISGELTKVLAIQTQVKNGVVTLSGTVPNQVVADRAVSVARNISGVTEVVSNIKVLDVELKPKQ